MMEQLLDKGVLRVLAADCEFRHVPRAPETNCLPVIGQIIAHRVDGILILLRSKPANRVVMFKAEPERIDHRMTGLADFRFS